jgi:DNA adenine methylase
MIGPLPWIGGKRRVAKRLAALLPPHQTYVEPFCGGAQVFFNKNPSTVEVLNDLDGELVNFLRVCQLHHPELLRYLEYSVPSRRWFEWYQDQDPATLTDVQRAARFFYLQKNSFAGRVHQRNFHYAVSKPSNYNAASFPEVLAAVAERLHRVQLECWPYEKVLERYDRTDTLFYIDPPYVQAPWYRFNFADEDFRTLAERLRSLKGQFLLSINDCLLAREVFGTFQLRELRFAYTASRRVSVGRELLISNYPLPESSQITVGS